ncbi:MAG: vWA domain-containing protein [Candidatus Parabeggiatoa sp.]|nr:vWA domain-containing protein [Candidatus Parabeggiatoa sp.]
MIHNKIITQLLCLSLLVFSSTGQAKGLSLSLNPTTVTRGKLLEVSVTVNRDEIKITEAAADVYLAVQFPDGSLRYYGPDVFSGKNKIVPMLTGWTITTLSSPVTLLTLTVSRALYLGPYKWYWTLCKVGQDVAKPGNWIGNAKAEVVRVAGVDDYSPSVSYEEDSSGDAAYSDEGATFAERPASAKPSSPTTASAPPPPSAPGKADTSTGASAGFAGGGSAGDAYGGAAEEADGGFDDSVGIWPPPPPEYEKDIPVQSGILTAGDIDDNLNLAAFQGYLDRAVQADRSQILPSIEVSDRVTLQLLDAVDQGISNAQVRISSAGTTRPLIETFAGTDGRFYLFPQFDKVNISKKLDLEITPPDDELSSPSTAFKTTLDLQQMDKDRTVTITLPHVVSKRPKALDIMFVIDTTGSMSDELRYITTELRDIISAVQDYHPEVFMRFGLILYRDEGDAYVVKSFDFTESLNEMQIQLNQQHASGGGDYPEAMEQALAAAVEAQWHDNNTARLVFLIADAPPHNEHLVPMLDQVRLAREKGLRVYSLAASGVADTAEYMMRSAAVLTQARYLFLTDDSGVGSSHSEPKIACYLVTRLDQLISRVIASELAGERVEPKSAEIVRTVGRYQNGVCQANVNQNQ